METETPLDVLSRAASLVDNQVVLRGTMKLDKNVSDSSVKELPRRGVKVRRKERRDPEYLSTKCRVRRTAATQTSVSLMKITNEVDTEEDCASSLSSSGLSFSDNSSMDDNCDSPLDMTTTNRKSTTSPVESCNDNEGYQQPIKPPQHSTVDQQRPSVITCASTLFQKKKQSTSTAPSGHNPRSTKSSEVKHGHRREILSGMCDPVIDEHFRRSLGKDYPEMFTENSVTNTVTDSGLSVDDHFAKALGETWLRLQGKLDSPDSNSAVSGSTRHSSSTPPPTSLQKPHSILNTQKSLA